MTLKNLHEEGFNIATFERRDKVGGLWSFDSSSIFTSKLEETASNGSKFIMSKLRPISLSYRTYEPV